MTTLHTSNKANGPCCVPVSSEPHPRWLWSSPGLSITENLMEFPQSTTREDLEVAQSCLKLLGADSRPDPVLRGWATSLPLSQGPRKPHLGCLAQSHNGV